MQKPGAAEGQRCTHRAPLGRLLRSGRAGCPSSHRSGTPAVQQYGAVQRGDRRISTVRVHQHGAAEGRYEALAAQAVCDTGIKPQSHNYSGQATQTTMPINTSLPPTWLSLP